VCVISKHLLLVGRTISVPREIKPCRERSVGAQLQAAAEMPTNIFNYCLYSRRSTATDHLTNLIRCLARDYDPLSVLRGRLQNLLLDAPECTGVQIVSLDALAQNTDEK
jgi:hypothetical protein